MTVLTRPRPTGNPTGNPTVTVSTASQPAPALDTVDLSAVYRLTTATAALWGIYILALTYLVTTATTTPDHTYAVVTHIPTGLFLSAATASLFYTVGLHGTRTTGALFAATTFGYLLALVTLDPNAAPALGAAAFITYTSLGAFCSLIGTLSREPLTR